MKISLKYIITICLGIILINSVQSQEWRPITGDSIYPINGADVLFFRFFNYHDTLVSSGWFTQIGSITTKGIAFYDSIEWRTMGLGITIADSHIEMADYNSNLYVGGSFAKIEDYWDSRYFGMWNGNSWITADSLGTFNSWIDGMVVWNDRLIIGGQYTLINDEYYGRLTSYDGLNFYHIGDADWPVESMTIYNDELIIGGAFYTVDGLYSRGIARYDGTTWRNVGNGIDGDVAYMIVDTINNFLYVGGLIYSVDTILVNNLAMWDGDNWHDVGGGVNSNILQQGLAFYRGNLYAGGHFTVAGNKEVYKVASWDGTNWDSLGVGVNYYVNALYVYKDELYVGGAFTAADDQYAPGMARWYEPPGYNCNMLTPRIMCEDTSYLYQGTVDVQFYNNNAYSGYWQWNFGDGQTDSVQNPLHSFTADTGIYNVCVTVEYEGCIKDTCREITILNGTIIEEPCKGEVSLSVYPNPAKDFIMIEATIESNNKSEIQIVSIEGVIQNVIKIQKGYNHFTEQTNSYGSGNYMCNLIIDGKVIESKQIVIVK